MDNKGIFSLDSVALRSIISLSLVVLMLTFPGFYPDIAGGLDGGYFTALNYFFDKDITQFKNFYYTFGPLGFLKSVLFIGDNFIFGLSIILAIKFIFILLLFAYGYKIGKGWMELFFMILLISASLGLDFYIYGIIVACIFLYKHDGKKVFVLFAIAIVVLAIFIKITIAIHSCLILFSFMAIEGIYFKNKKNVLQFVAAFFVVLLLSWFLIFRTYSNLFTYLHAWTLYGFGNSDAVTMIVPNNWILLFGSVLFFLSIPLFERKKEVYFFYGILLLSYFATYKYAIARQENYHSKTLLDFMIFFSLLFLIIMRKAKPYIIVFFMAGLMFYYGNLIVNKTYHVDDRISFWGVKKFTQLLNYEEYKSYNQELSKKNLEDKILPKSMLDRIGNEKIDFTPWDFTYIYANKLNFKPKPSLQSGGFPVFLVELDAEHIKKSTDLKFILWEKDKWMGELGGVDDKYLLNEDGQYLYEVLNNYEEVEASEKVRLLQRTASPRLNNPRFLFQTRATWNTWIKVPAISNGYLRAKLEISGSLWRTVKQALYKTGGTYIEYKMQDGRVVRYRFTKNNTKTGLWIAPYLQQFSNDLKGDQVAEIRFIYTDEKFKMNDEILIDWEEITFRK